MMDDGLNAVKRWRTPEEVAITIRTLAIGNLPYSTDQTDRNDCGLLVSKS